MKKKIEFGRVRVPGTYYEDTLATMQRLRPAVPVVADSFRARRGISMWSQDTFSEFLADYEAERNEHDFRITAGDLKFMMFSTGNMTFFEVEGPKRDELETILRPYERDAEKYTLKSVVEPTVFIGHGGSPAWRELKEHLHEKHHYNVITYESGARAGHVIRDVVDEMAAKASFAILVMTAEDQQADGTYRARQNVIHEAGLFQGKLGYARAIMVVEDGVDVHSNVQGVNYIGFKQRISESFGEVVATLRREFGK